MKTDLTYRILILPLLLLLGLESFGNQHCPHTVYVTSGKQIQKLFSSSNTVYVICSDIDLEGERLIIPDGSTLKFNRGSFRNGVIDGCSTRIVAANYEIFRHGETKHRGYKDCDGKYHYVSSHNGAVLLSGTWSNTNCKSNWTGLHNIRKNQSASLAINNFIILFSSRSTVKIPRGNYHIFSTIKINNKSIDWNNSQVKLLLPSKVEDNNISLPIGGEAIRLRHPGDLISVSGDSVIFKNLILDGNIQELGDIAAGLGKEHSLRIAKGHNILVQNIVVRNTICCGVVVNQKCYDVTFHNVRWDNIAEHGVYARCSIGNLVFDKCVFHNCSHSARIKELRNGGISACIRPAINDGENMIKRTLKIYMNDCVFCNDGEMPALTCYDGGTYYEYRHCTWKGKMLGYSGGKELSEALGDCTEHVFIDCTNPITRYSGYNTRRRLFNCKKVYNLLSDLVEASNCECFFHYSDVYNRYSDYFAKETSNNEVVVEKCLIVSDGASPKDRIKINNPRSMRFDKCRFVVLDKNLSNTLIYANGNNRKMIITVSNSYFDLSGMHFLKADNCQIKISDCTIKNCGEYLITGKNNNVLQENCKMSGNFVVTR